MRAITVSNWGEKPIFTADLPAPGPPPDGSSHSQIRVIASGLHGLVRSQSAGKHYTVANADTPYIPGADGVGMSSDGRLVYFNSIATGGAFAELINVPIVSVFPIPEGDEASDEDRKRIAVYVAGLLNPAMSSWMALRTRTTFDALPKGFTVFILGVTSLSGKIAVSLARQMGASRVIGAARNAEAMKSLGLDQAITLADPVTDTDFANALKDVHVHVLLDYVYGPAVMHLLGSLASSPMKADELETQYVQIGSLGSEVAELPSSVLRSKNITLKGSGPGSWSMPQLGAELPGLLASLVRGVGEFGVKERGLEDVTEAWDDMRTRTVFVM